MADRVDSALKENQVMAEVDEEPWIETPEQVIDRAGPVIKSLEQAGIKCAIGGTAALIMHFYNSEFLEKHPEAAKILSERPIRAMDVDVYVAEEDVENANVQLFKDDLLLEPMTKVPSREYDSTALGKGVGADLISNLAVRNGGGKIVVCGIDSEGKTLGGTNILYIEVGGDMWPYMDSSEYVLKAVLGTKKERGREILDTLALIDRALTTQTS